MAAFDKQSKGKICPLCNIKFSLATYRTHMDVCQIDENDTEIEVLASYSREEAINLRAGPEIVIGEEENRDSPRPTPKSQNPPKRRRTDERKPAESENPPETMQPFSFDSPAPETSGNQPELPENIEGPIKTSQDSETRRRSQRIAQKPAEIPVEVVKKEVATISEVLTAISNFELRVASSTTNWPYYMKLAVKIMKKVISTRKADGSYYSDDFWRPADVIAMYRFVEHLSESAKCILMRLVIRRPGWYHLEKLQQRYSEIPEIEKAVVELTRWEFFDDESKMKDLDEVLTMADLPVLKSVAKKFKLDTSKNRQETIQLIKKCAQSQKTIFGGVCNVEASIMRNLKQELGTCVSIRQHPVQLFKALYTIYCPVSTNSSIVIDNPSSNNPYQDLIYLVSELEAGKVRFPAPNPNPHIASFYKSWTMLNNYVTAKSIETTLVTFMANGRLAEALDLAIDSKELIDAIPDYIKQHCQTLELHERKFTAIWVLTRCIAHGATVLERQKKWGMAVEWHRNLLMAEDYQGYCLDSRGVWWDRMLLNLDAHLKEKKECAKYALLALEDPHVLEKELLLIQDRALKLKDLPDLVPKLSIGNPEKRTISAPTISKNLGDGRINRFVIREADQDLECSVEEVVRRRYMEEGFSQAVHDEGSTWHTVFGLLFYDVIFEKESVPTTWFSEVQDCPADMANTLYSKRSKLFENRFSWLRNASEDEIEQVIRKIWTQKASGDVVKECNKECSWKIFNGSVEQCLDFYRCITREALLKIFRRLATDYRNCRSGFPDLTLWNPESRQVAVVEVKGPGDRLSTKQRLWLAFFADNGIRAEVCHVTAESSRRLS